MSVTDQRLGIAGAVEALTVPLGLAARVHARSVAADAAAVGHRADELVATASVFKVPVLVELCRRAAAGDVDLRERVRVPAERRTVGPTGISHMLDDVELSLRDLALSMMSVSDNTATDVIIELLGLDAVNATLAELGLQDTVLVGDCQLVLDTLARDVGAPSAAELGAHLAALDPDERAEAAQRMRASASVDAQHTSRSTAAETTALLARIWRDEAGPPEACAEMRRILALQVWPHRLRSGFPDEVTVAGKTGTLPFWRNEAGMVSFPDGAAYAVAVFCESDDPVFFDPDADRAIGRLARLAIDHLRGAAA